MGLITFRCPLCNKILTVVKKKVATTNIMLEVYVEVIGLKINGNDERRNKMLIKTMYESDEPIWECADCGTVFSITLYTRQFRVVVANPNIPPACPDCEKRNTKLINKFPWENEGDTTNG
jgi:transcription elongation factor Elf1